MDFLKDFWIKVLLEIPFHLLAFLKNIIIKQRVYSYVSDIQALLSTPALKTHEKNIKYIP